MKRKGDENLKEKNLEKWLKGEDPEPDQDRPRRRHLERRWVDLDQREERQPEEHDARRDRSDGLQVDLRRECDLRWPITRQLRRAGGAFSDHRSSLRETRQQGQPDQIDQRRHAVLRIESRGVFPAW